jgi:hypothetical protein
MNWDERVKVGLCYRCENRARYCESHGTWLPREQCAWLKKAVSVCYMYQPVQPVAVEPLKAPPGTMTADIRVAGLSDTVLVQAEQEEKTVLFWRPRDEVSG